MNQADRNKFAIDAQAKLHHAWFLGLQLMVSSHKSPAIVEDWIFRLFRRQHLDKFLSSFAKLGLDGQPHAVACAKYHVLSNGIGGVKVDFMAESDQKAWVRFRYPRWMYDGATICGIPLAVSRGFLRGWYAHNGVSLKNPRLGFVCVSEDMSGEFGLCGYFREYNHDLSEEERLQFAKDELPPPYIETEQPVPPGAQWPAERLQKANRNYALDYIRNGLRTLAEVIGEQEATELAGRAARLIGLQYYPLTARMIGATDGNMTEAAEYIACMMQGMGDDIQVSGNMAAGQMKIRQTGLRIVRNMPAQERALLLTCWKELWLGAIRSHRQMLTLDMETTAEDGLLWIISTRT